MAYSSSSSSQGNNGNVEEEDFSKYLPLYRASAQGNWEEALILLEQHKDAIQAPLNHNLETALHVAAKAGAASFAEKLVAMLPDEALCLKTRYDGPTPLHLAALYGNVEVAEILVRRNYNLLYHTSNSGLFPIHSAARNCRKSKDAFLYFLGVTKDDEDGQPNPYAGPTGAAILANLITSKFYDVALELVEKYPELSCHPALNTGGTPLDAIVEYDCPIINKTIPRFLQSSIYY